MSVFFILLSPSPFPFSPYNPTMSARDKIVAQLQNGDFAGFEAIYAMAESNPQSIPWGGFHANPRLVEWFDQQEIDGRGRRALVVGCGLGGDAHELAQRGFTVTAFDIAQTAIDWCKQRFPNSGIDFVVADMFAPPNEWLNGFDFVLDVRIVQALPLVMREDAISAEAAFVAPNGHLLIITERRDDRIANPPGPPWSLSRSELALFNKHGLETVKIEALTDYADRWRALFSKQ